jgi:DNA-binding NarL/FixJ family response regulator
MPAINGLALQKRLAARGSKLPIIFLTAFEDLQAHGEALKHGAVALLQKPVDEEVLFEAIREAESKQGELPQIIRFGGKLIRGSAGCVRLSLACNHDKGEQYEW